MISCESCIGACCQNVRVVLSGSEAIEMIAAGTDLIPILPAFMPLEYEGRDSDLEDDEDKFLWSANLDYIDELEEEYRKAGHEMSEEFWNEVRETAKSLESDEGFFSMNGRCGNLQEDGRCGNYENRPRVCLRFPMGGTSCLKMRLRAGVGTPVNITQKPADSY